MGTILPAIDPRRRRTREVLVSAFVTLARRRRYHEIRIGDIVAAADVSRSTFYEHFPSKDALLAGSMAEALSLLARVPFGRADTHQVATLLAHFWDTRVLARSLLSGTALRAVRNELVAQIEACFKATPACVTSLPPRLAAHALADGLLLPILAWLAGEAWCDAHVVADALARSSRPTLAGLVEPAAGGRSPGADGDRRTTIAVSTRGSSTAPGRA